MDLKLREREWDNWVIPNFETDSEIPLDQTLTWQIYSTVV